MAPPSNTPKKRLMIVNCAKARCGKSAALMQVKEKLEEKWGKPLFCKRANKGKDAICVFLCADIVVGLSTIGDSTTQIKAKYNEINQWLEENKYKCGTGFCLRNQNTCSADIFITAAHPSRVFMRALGEIAGHGKYEQCEFNHRFIPDGNEKEKETANAAYANEVLKAIDHFIEQLRLPEKLYLFMDAKYLITCLKKDEIKVSLPETCNDPFEILPQGKKALPTMTDGIGFICFSEEWASSTMWSHYANKHKGVCLEFRLPVGSLRDHFQINEKTDFDIKAGILNIEADYSGQYIISDQNDESSSGPTMIKVAYYPFRSNQTDKIIYKLKNGKMRKLPFSRLLAAKGQEWSYEKEWRLFVNIDKCESYHDGCFFVNGLTQYISKIMLGWKCDLRPLVIENILKKYHHKAECVKMEACEKLFAVREAQAVKNSKLEKESPPMLWRVPLELSHEQRQIVKKFINEEHPKLIQRIGFDNALSIFLMNKLSDTSRKNN